MNKLFKPILSFSRLFYRCTLNNQIIIQNVPQKVFSERILLDMRQIEMTWRRSKDKNIIDRFIYKRCVNNSELLTYAVDMIHIVCNRMSSSHILIFEIVKTFGNYIVENNLKVILSSDQKMDILCSVLHVKSYEVVQLVCNIFKIQDESSVCREFIKNLKEDQKFSEAAFIVCALQLQKEFHFTEILLPLLIEGNYPIAIIYMKNYPDIQLKAAKYLDSHLTINDTIVESDSKPKRLFKTLSSLINTFKIPLDNCPNLQFIRSRGAINILVKRRNEQSVSEESFEEMIKNIVGDNEDLKKYLLQKLIRKKYQKTAMKMSEIFNINIQDLNILVAINEDKENSANADDDQFDDSEDFPDSQNFDVCDISDEYLEFALSLENIKVIDTKENFINCLDDIQQNYKMVGIDSEWKPHFGLSRDRLALIQIAVHDKVYILDLLLLSECLDTEHWDRLLDDIFGNPSLIKLGCAIMGDVNMILESIKGSQGKAIKFSHILDMAIFYEKIVDVYPVEMHNYSDKTFTRGLSSMCDIILGRPLNKEDRLCDWEKRPLMSKQLQYAALDAHCLLQMYDKLKEDSVQKNINFEHLAKVAIVLTTSQWKPKRKYKGVKNNEEFHVHKSLPIEQLKVVMDSEFEKQGKELRKLGADVIILKSTDSFDKAVELSKKEGRIILCRDAAHHLIKNKVKPGFCYFLSSSTEDEIQVSYFLQRFNIQVSTKSIYSRCLTCNSNRGTKLSTEDLKILHELSKNHISTNSVLQDNLSCFSSELQTALHDIFNSNITIDFSTKGSSLSANEIAFLCKNCGCIS